MAKKQVTVVGGSQCNQFIYDLSYQIGNVIATSGAILITGGRGGVMEAAAKGALEADGITVGILPGSNKAASNQYNSVIIPTGMGHARNVINVLAADVLVVMPGSYGTLTEWGFGAIYQTPMLYYEDDSLVDEEEMKFHFQKVGTAFKNIATFRKEFLQLLKQPAR